MGTRFYLTTEGDHAHPAIKQVLLGARETDTVIVPGVFGNNRHWKNPFAQALLELKSQGASKEKIDALKQWGQEAKLRGDLPHAGVSIGMVTGCIRQLKCADSVIQEITEGSKEVLAQIEVSIRTGK